MSEAEGNYFIEMTRAFSDSCSQRDLKIAAMINSGKKLREVGHDFGISGVRVRQIHMRVIRTGQWANRFAKKRIESGIAQHMLSLDALPQRARPGWF